jgi:hypothetical protein
MPFELYSDNIIYTWYGAFPNEAYVAIDDTNRTNYRVTDASALNTNTLTVMGVGEADGKTNDLTIAYFCGIKNHLRNKDSIQLPVDPNAITAEEAKCIPVFIIS